MITIVVSPVCFRLFNKCKKHYWHGLWSNNAPLNWRLVIWVSWSQTSQILPGRKVSHILLSNLPNQVRIIGFISGLVLSGMFFCVAASQWQCHLTNCNRVWDWAIGAQKHNDGSDNKLNNDLNWSKSHLTDLNHISLFWQSNKYQSTMPTLCLSLTMFITFTGAPWTAFDTQLSPIVYVPIL